MFVSLRSIVTGPHHARGGGGAAGGAQHVRGGRGGHQRAQGMGGEGSEEGGALREGAEQAHLGRTVQGRNSGGGRCVNVGLAPGRGWILSYLAGRFDKPFGYRPGACGKGGT